MRIKIKSQSPFGGGELVIQPPVEIVFEVGDLALCPENAIPADCKRHCAFADARTALEGTWLLCMANPNGEPVALVEKVA